MSSTKKKILFLCNKDYGQANVILSATYALIKINPDVEVHIGSQAGFDSQLRRFVDQCNKVEGAPAGNAVKLHPIIGLSHFEAVDRPDNPALATWLTKPGLVNTSRNMLTLAGLALPWSPEEFFETYKAIEEVFEEVKPDVTVVEAFFAPATTFANQANINWICLAPNTIKEFALPMQPKLAMLWKYPIIQSSLPFPIPLHLVPLNVFFNLVAGYGLFADSRYKRVSAHLAKHAGPGIEIITWNELGLLKAPPKGLRILVANSPDIDFPFETIPESITPCGPITRAAPKIEIEDPELAEWLSRGPTVFISLGTHHFYDLPKATEFAHAIRNLLDRAEEHKGGSEDEARLQVLWKMPRKLDENENTTEDSGPLLDVKAIMNPFIKQDRVKITDWFTAEPKSILESGHLVCCVSHGGSNSFHEALCTGIPQVVLPGWGDCYDFAIRSEILGIGKWANRKAKPYWEREELSEKLIEVVLGPQAQAMQEQALALAKRHPEGAGREKAAREILDLLEKNEEKV